MHYGFDDDYGYDRYDHDRDVAYAESLWEEGLQPCNTCGDTFEIDVKECPTCARREAIRQQILKGEIDEGAICSGCSLRESEATFLNASLCWPCYQTVSSGRSLPDTGSFADPGGRSALRAARPGNPRVHPCPNCRAPNALTPQDKERGYQCDRCADAAERGLAWDE